LRDTLREPARTIQSKPAFAGADRHATARALEVEHEIDTLSTAPLPAVHRPDVSETEEREMFVAEEIEPCDYLEAEVRKVDRALATQFAKNESPSLIVHIVVGAIDMIVLAFACAPFMVLINSFSGFGETRSRVAAGAIVVIVSFFYLAITQALCGKTFGMMLTNTRVVDSANFEAISPGRAVARTVGYFVALAPAALGFLWVAVNRKRRGWHDLVSGTLVARDF
jgi:uncharacterized RDD family membrane protein YckC